MKKSYFVIIALLICFAMFTTACGNPGGGGQSDNTQAAVTSAAAADSTTTASTTASEVSNEQKVLTAFIPLDNLSDPDIDNNEFIKWAEEQTGIKIVFDVGNKETDEQINLILSSGTKLSDIFLTGFSRARITQYGGEGIFLPLEDLLEKNGVNAKSMLIESTGSDNLDPIRSPDGHVYTMPHIEVCYHCMYCQKMWINQTWLDTLGLDTPTTTDEFYDVLVAFKNNDPNQNGIADEVPLSGCTDWWHSMPERFLMNSFTYYGRNNDDGISIVDGKILASYIQPEFKDGLAYLNMLYNEGLMDSEAYTQKSDQLRQLCDNGADNMLGACATGTPSAFADDTGEVTKNYVTLSPLTGPNGFRAAALSLPSVDGACAVSKDCSDPETAVIWLDFLLSEEATLRQMFGVEGVDWRRGDEGAVGLDGNPALVKEINVLPGMVQQNQGIEILCNISERVFNGRQVDPDDIWYIESRLALETKNKYDIGITPPEVYVVPFMTLDDTVKKDEYKVPIRTYVDENIAKFITGARDLEKEWDVYLSELESLGINEYLAILQKYYDSAE